MNSEKCITCKKPIEDKPWTLLHDFCPVHQAEWWAEMDQEERQLNFQREWEEYIECVEHDSASEGELDGFEWDWADWLAEGERQELRAFANMVIALRRPVTHNRISSLAIDSGWTETR